MREKGSLKKTAFGLTRTWITIFPILGKDRPNCWSFCIFLDHAGLAVHLLLFQQILAWRGPAIQMLYMPNATVSMEITKGTA